MKCMKIAFILPWCRDWLYLHILAVGSIITSSVTEGAVAVAGSAGGGVVIGAQKQLTMHKAAAANSVFFIFLSFY